MLPPPTTMPTWTPSAVDLGDLAGDERAERRVDAVLAIAEERLAGQLEQDPPVAERLRRGSSRSPAGVASQLLPERVAGEAADPDVLADRGDLLGDQVADGALLVAERLVVAGRPASTTS